MCILEIYQQCIQLNWTSIGLCAHPNQFPVNGKMSKQYNQKSELMRGTEGYNLWLPEEALHFTRGGGGAVTPPFDPRLEPRESASTKWTWQGLVETEGSTCCPQGPGEDNGRIVGGVLCMPLFRFFTQTLAPCLKLTTSTRATVVRGGSGARERLEECCAPGELLQLKVRCACEDEGRDVRNP